MVRILVRQGGAAVRMLAVLTLLLGVLYPLAGVALGNVIGDRSDGSPITVSDRAAGSRLIGQAFDGPGWFQGRPSATEYDFVYEILEDL